MGTTKLLLILSVIGISVYLYAAREYYPAPVKQKNVTLVRTEASFLTIDDSVLKELKESKDYAPIATPDQSELGKEKLFEAPNKKFFSF